MDVNAMFLFILSFFMEVEILLAQVSITIHGNQLNGTSLLLECVIKSYTHTASWIKSDTSLTTCISIGACTDYGTGTNYIFFSNQTGLYVNINVLDLNENNKKWICRYDSEQAADSVIVQVLIPLYGPIMKPNSIVTKIVGESIVFECSAQSFPISTLMWSINGSLLSTTSSITNQTSVISTTFYTAKKSDNGQLIVCTATNQREYRSAQATLQILYQPTVNILPYHNPYNVIENTTDIQLTCNVLDANPVVTSYRWYRDGFKILREITTNYTVPKLQREDSGRYRCDASNSVGNSNASAEIQMNVLYGVYINKIEKQQPREGEQLSVTCSGQSNPVITNSDVIWTKQNNNTFRQSGKDLQISHVNRQDSGAYVCTVVITLIPSVGQLVNVTGKATANVDILYPPTVTISPNFNSYDVIENSTDVKLICNVLDANPAVTSYRWYVNGTHIVGDHAYFTIQKVKKSHIGSYQCDAINIIGYSTISPILQINILYGVNMNTIETQQPTEGERFMVTCSGRSNPVINNDDVIWSKQNNNTFRQSGKDLVIPHVNRQDGGTYVCTVVITLIPSVGQSVNATGITTANVDVLYRPTVFVSSNYSFNNIIENTSNVQLTCSVIDANPRISSYRWYKNGVQRNVFTKTYTLVKVQRIDAGNYSCDATNFVGVSDVSPGQVLNVLYGPEKIYVSPNNSYYDVTEEIDSLGPIKCSADCNPLCVFLWSGPNMHTESTSLLYLQNIDWTMDGTYLCTASNGIYNKTSISIVVNVNFAPRLDQDSYSSPTIIPTKASTTLNITVNVLARPMPTTEWVFQRFGFNFQLPVYAENIFGEYKHSSSISVPDINTSDFGYYIVTVKNSIGILMRNFTVLPQTKPVVPEAVFVLCSSSFATVIWKSQFNGGAEQKFYIRYWTSDQLTKKSSSFISDPGENYYGNITFFNLLSQNTYNFVITASNVFGESNSSILTCIVYPENQLGDENKTLLNAGIVLLVISTLLTLLAASIAYTTRIWFKKKQLKSSSGNYTDTCTTNPVFTETYETLNNTTPSTGTAQDSYNQRDRSLDTYEELDNTALTKDKICFQNVQVQKQDVNQKIDGVYANMFI